jgi:hypothetical protein
VVIEWCEWPETATAAAWDAALSALPEPTVFQAHAWGEYKRQAGWKVVRGQIVVDGSPRGMAQCLVRELRIARVAVVWIPGGPAGDPADRVHLGHALRQRYRRWSLCLRANFTAERRLTDADTLQTSGWSPADVRVGHPVTFHVDLGLDLAVRQTALHANWRRNLHRGRQRGVSVQPWPDGASLEPAHAIYRDMSELKGVRPTMSVEDLHGLRAAFGRNLTLASAVDRDGALLAIRGFVRIETRAQDIIAAVAREGRAAYASYPLTWDVLQMAEAQGVRVYDLGGADAERATGVYNFKRGLGGREVTMIGEWEWTTSRLARWGLNRAAALSGVR